MFIKVNLKDLKYKNEKRYYCENCNDVVVGIVKNKYIHRGLHSLVYCEICNNFLQYLKANPRNSVLINDYFKLNFGKHKGKTITEIVNIDEDYANWFINNKFKSKAKNKKAELDSLALVERFKEALSLKKEVDKLLYQTLYNNL